MKKVLLFLLLGFCFRANGQSFTSSNLPIIIIDGPSIIPDEPKATASLKIIFNGAGKINNTTDAANGYNGPIGIERRGSTSQQLSDKKPFSIETRDNTGTDLKISLLGMPAESDWVLIAPFSDKSLMRDALAYMLAGKIMPYAPRVRFCELILNGAYQGVYVLSENIKRDSSRVNISKLNNLDIAGNDVTGGYILKIDKITGGAGADGWKSPKTPSTFYQYHYPKPDEIMPQQKQYITGLLQKFENVLSSSDIYDPIKGYASVLDADSFVDFLIINELSKNVDGYRLSTFLYKDKDSKNPLLKMGPVWDFNIAFGNANYCQGGQTTGFAYDYNSVCPLDNWQIPFFWNKLLADHKFRAKVATRWNSLRQKQFSNTALTFKIDSVATLLDMPASRNFQKWPILGKWIWPNNFVGASYPQETNFVKNWILDRAAWLDKAFEGFLITATEPISTQSILVAPNPSAADKDVVFHYFVDTPTDISISIFDSKGKPVATVLDHKYFEGPAETIWENPSVPSGLYYFRVSLNDYVVGVGRVVIGQ